MNDLMCIRGYGVRMESLAPHIDLRKLDTFIEQKAGITLDYDYFTDEALDTTLNRLDCCIHAAKCPEGLSILDIADSTRLCECISNNRGEWFFLLPSVLPWEFSTGNWPQTIVEAEALLLNTLRPFVKEEVANDEITTLLTYIYDIS